MGMSYTQNRCQFDGALYDTTEELNDNASFNSNADTNKPHLIGIDASRGNSAYSGTKLQVPALQTLVCIKFVCLNQNTLHWNLKLTDELL